MTFRSLIDYGKPQADLRRKKGNSLAILLHNQHMQTDFPKKIQCFPLLNPSDNKLALAEPTRHFST
jgi:hypothetical protein